MIVTMIVITITNNNNNKAITIIIITPMTKRESKLTRLTKFIPAVPRPGPRPQNPHGPEIY